MCKGKSTGDPLLSEENGFAKRNDILQNGLGFCQKMQCEKSVVKLRFRAKTVLFSSDIINFKPGHIIAAGGERSIKISH